MPIGRLTRKIHRHDPPVMSSRMIRPPASGPVIVAMPMTAPTKPKTRARSCGGKLTWMTERTCGYISAAIVPWSTRERSSMIALCARPHSADAIDEAGHPDEEQLLSAKDVTKPAARDEHHRVGKPVARNDELDVGVVGREVAADRGDRDVHDGHVEQHHEQRGHHAAEREPAPRVELVRVRGGPSGGSSLRSGASGAISVVSVISCVVSGSASGRAIHLARVPFGCAATVTCLRAGRSARCARCRPRAPRTSSRRGSDGCAAAHRAWRRRARCPRRR